jgi:preprotein translocase subunit YajC
MFDFLMILAQTSAPAGGGAGGGQPGAPGDSFLRFMLPMLLALGVFYVFLFRGQRKERQKHSSMLANMKRNDRVQTIGGVLGTVVDVREHEVVVKVDETSNVKMRFNRAAIKEVLSEPAEMK